MADVPDGAGLSENQIQTADTVVLKANSNLIGTVERTFHDFNTHQDPLAGLLIFSHVPVPDQILQEFLISRAPPKGYIFVKFAEEEFGNSLVAEEDVVLLSRCFAVGDTVKIHTKGHMIGTVVGVHDSYILQPICWPRPGQGEFMFTFSDEPVEICDPTCEQKLPSGVSHPRPHELLYNVPGRELKRAQDFMETDHVLYHDWLGTVKTVEVDVAIILPNESVVWVYDPWELFVVIPNLDRSPVAIPELELDDVRLPELNISLYNGIDTMQPEQFLRGQLVVTNHRNLKNGRWLRGGYDQNAEPAGRILDVRSRRLQIQWLCPNAFGVENLEDIATPPLNISPYENLTSFRNARDLRRKRDIIVYDHDKSPVFLEDYSIRAPMNTESRSNERASQDPESSNTPSILETPLMGMDLRVGERVKFVDNAAALRKYGATTEKGHGRLIKVPRDATLGFDLNEFKIISATEDVTIQWQDQSKSRHRSTEMRAIILPEQDLVPGDLVTAKEGMKQVRNQDGQFITSDFNEMSYFEHQQDLHPAKVGVLQSVNSLERVAQVRWFSEPKIELLEAGTILSNESMLGKIGDVIEDVSLYEIMSFPALTCRRRDVVIIVPPSSWANGAVPVSNVSTNASLASSRRWRPALLSQLGNEDNQGLVSYLKSIARARLEGVMSLFGSNSNLPNSGANSSDWVAEIVDIGLDGLLTVRFGALETCQDIRISRDLVLLTVDEDDAYSGEEGMLDTVGSWTVSDDEDISNSSGELDAIDEEIDYEGGRRIDDDSDDGGWVTDEDVSMDEAPIEPVSKNNDEDIERQETDPLQFKDIDMLDAPSNPQPTPKPNETDIRDPFKQTSALLSRIRDNQPPPPFDILSSIPTNQFRASDPATTSMSFIKRIAREHRILLSSLPSSTIYVRTYESRLDLLRCLIIGPADTPYELAPFLVDLHLGPHFPREPPTAHFHSWTSGLGRINPNLYEEGKICLSLLGTWPGRGEGEGWSEKATILQVLVSLQGLVFVRQPLYNEAGFELYREEKLFTHESQQYNEKAFVIARGFVKHALLSPVEGLEDVLAWLYLPPVKEAAGGEGAKPRVRNDHRDLLRQTIERANTIMRRSEELKRDTEGGGADCLVDGTGDTGDREKVFLKPLSLGAVVQLKRTVKELGAIVNALLSGGGSCGSA